MPHGWRFKTCRTQKSARDAVSKAQQNRSPQAISMFSVRFLSRYSLPAFVAPRGTPIQKAICDGRPSHAPRASVSESDHFGCDPVNDFGYVVTALTLRCLSVVAVWLC